MELKMHKKYTVFATDIYEVRTTVDTSALLARCHKHQQSVESLTLSNNGGYQGHNFYDQEFTDLVLSNLPIMPNQSMPKIRIQSWINLNGHGHWNSLHNHLDESCLISGVFYVCCPKNSGDIMFYDPRFLSNAGTHYRYYNTNECNSGGHISITPSENLLLFFPPSLMHMVTPNMSQEERCSIAFNIMVEPGQKL